MKDYIKSFIIGSSFPVFIIFFLSVINLNNKNYTYETYTLVAPLYLGLMNMYSLYLYKNLNLTIEQRYQIVGIISPIIVITFAFLNKAYIKTNKEWIKYAIYLCLKHFLIFNIIVKTLETKLENFNTDHNNEIDKMVKLIINRGILAPNCKWWNTSSRELKDASGIELYYKLKKNYDKIIPIKILDEDIYLVTDINYIKTILDNSPFVFGVGKLKYKMFHSFMADNVGVSQGCPWIKRRKLNELVLSHRFNINYIIENNDIPLNFDDFQYLSKLIAMRIVFNDTKIIDEIFQIFSEANSIESLYNKDFKIDPDIMNVYLNYLNENIDSPNPDSLIYYITKYTNKRYEIINQIPHFIFPINGLIHTNAPRIILLLIKHPIILKKLKESNFNKKYLRNCILETLRLNNPVVTTFRTLLYDYQFDTDLNCKKGTQFLILNNPVLREPEFFKNPNQFIPERWNNEKEKSYYSIMFNQGPQKCPGKELSISILQQFITSFFKKTSNYNLTTNIVIDKYNIPQMINPCSIKFKLEF